MTERDDQPKQEPGDHGNQPVVGEITYSYQNLNDVGQRVTKQHPDGPIEVYVRDPSGIVAPEDFHGLGG